MPNTSLGQKLKDTKLKMTMSLAQISTSGHCHPRAEDLYEETILDTERYTIAE